MAVLFVLEVIWVVFLVYFVDCTFVSTRRSVRGLMRLDPTGIPPYRSP
jgi:hypothetical protein